MQKKRKGLWLFIFSLIPGAGEMYMGFSKQGISIMLLFWAMIGLAGGLNLGWLVLFLPVLWFYSFFNVHNLKSLPDDEFYSLEDSYILHMDHLFAGSGENFMSKYRKLLAIVMIVFGFAVLWNNFTDLLYWILPDFLANTIGHILYRIPQIAVALLIIVGGWYILTDHKKKLGSTGTAAEEDKDAHYWEPYQPYQQPINPETPEPKDTLKETAADTAAEDSGKDGL